MEIIALKQWFEKEKRDLPWRTDVTPYKVWISEIMLQQTQVAVVTAYFEKWMKQFPSIEALAGASIDEVLKLWEGLGYYSRARNIHEAARYLIAHHYGTLPSSRDELEKIKGLGPYTVGAILSFAFHQKAAAVDGNVARVLSRHYLIEENIALPKTQKELQKLMISLLPDHEPWLAMEAFIELGARICQKEPKCTLCPLKKSCQGFKTNRAPFLPNRGKKTDYISLERIVSILICGEEVLLKKGQKGKVMADLYEFPYFEKGEETVTLGLDATFDQHLNQVRHSFTRYRVQLFPSVWKVRTKKEIEGFLWKSLDELKQLPFSSGHRRILDQLFFPHTYRT